jgi:hypothetical protein
MTTGDAYSILLQAILLEDIAPLTHQTAKASLIEH